MERVPKFKDGDQVLVATNDGPKYPATVLRDWNYWHLTPGTYYVGPHYSTDHKSQIVAEENIEFYGKS